MDGRIPYYSTTTNNGYTWTAEHKNNGTWIYKTNSNEDPLISIQMDLVDLKSIIQQMVVLLIDHGRDCDKTDSLLSNRI